MVSKEGLISPYSVPRKKNIQDLLQTYDKHTITGQLKHINTQNIYILSYLKFVRLHLHPRDIN